MSTYQKSTTSGEDKQVETACGARIMLTPDLPYIHHQDETVYFCGQGCKQLYDIDPLNSCMADRLLSGK